MNILIADAIIESAVESSFSSIGVFQELIKGVCNDAGVTGTSDAYKQVDTVESLARTIALKANDYAARHQRALEAIAAGHMSGGAKGDLPAVFTVLPGSRDSGRWLRPHRERHATD